ncbi:MAG: hypothetical protein V3R49_04030, partial [Gammaproteobacteria bacterium]
APPYAYGQWSVSAGAITSACPAGPSACEVISTGDGFLQRKILLNVGAAGTTYHIQTIRTDAGASGDLTSLPSAGESFILVTESVGGQPQNPSQNGIASIQTMIDNTANGTFDSQANIDTGWAAVVGEDNVRINQGLSENVAVAGEQFISNFNYGSENDPTTGAVLNYQMAIDQEVGLFSADGGAPTDVQKFALQQTDRTETGGSVNLGGVDVLWAQGNEVRATWVGQTISAVNPAPGDPFQGSIFGFNSVDNLTTGANAFVTSRDTTGPFDWPVDPGNGPTPIFTTPVF